MNGLINEIKKISETKRCVLIGIDGPCASGKTTLASRIADETGAQVIHADDFFLPVEMRTWQRLSQAGGNIHYERFAQEVASGIASGKAFEYGIYNCAHGQITEKHTVIPEGIIVVEGAYSLHPKMGIDWDLRVFVEAPIDVRLDRILARNGKEKLETFKEKWIPMEDRYFEAFGIKEICDIVIR